MRVDGKLVPPHIFNVLRLPSRAAPRRLKGAVPRVQLLRAEGAREDALERRAEWRTWPCTSIEGAEQSATFAASSEGRISVKNRVFQWRRARVSLLQATGEILRRISVSSKVFQWRRAREPLTSVNEARALLGEP